MICGAIYITRISDLDSHLHHKLKGNIGYISLCLPERKRKLVVLLVDDGGVEGNFDKAVSFETELGKRLRPNRVGLKSFWTTRSIASSVHSIRRDGDVADLEKM